MTDLDKAKAIRKIIDETGCSQAAIAGRLGHNESWVWHLLTMLEPEIAKVIEHAARRVEISDVREAKAGTGGDLALAAKVLQKAAKDDLSTRQTRVVAEAVKRAQDFDGAKGVREVLATPSARILEQAGTDLLRRAAKSKPAVRTLTGKIKFQWVRDQRTILAEQGLTALSALVSAIARSEDDRGGGKAVLKDLRRRLRAVLKQMDDVLGR